MLVDQEIYWTLNLTFQKYADTVKFALEKARV